jgi:hypothetical protein
LAVALKAGLALADVLSGQVAAFGVLHTFPGQLGDLALVNILTVVPIPFIAREAGAVVRPNVVCTVGKHIAWSVFALIVIRHTATFASPTIVAVALGVQTGTIDTTMSRRVEAVV